MSNTQQSIDDQSTGAHITGGVWIVVPAAGIGQRMQSDVPKQYLSLAEKTVLEYTLEKLLSIGRLAGIVVALHADDTWWETLAVAQHEKIRTVTGGEQRSDSVSSALASLNSEVQASDWVLVHDAARPCVSVKNIDQLITALIDDPVGGILAFPVSDTLKKVDGSHIQHTVSRDNLWQAQTPQMFRYGLLVQALEQADNSQTKVTDEASAIECLGYSPQLVLGEKDNIKITHPDDLWLAAMILEKQAQQDKKECASQL